MKLHRNLIDEIRLSRRVAACGPFMSATSTLSLLLFFVSSVSAAEDLPVDSIKSAVSKSLKLLERSAAKYIEERSCFTCHHQALPTMTLSLANSYGFKIDSDALRAQSEFTNSYFKQRIDRLIDGQGVPGGPYTAGYALLTLEADSWQSDKTTDALVSYLLKTQAKNGSWRIRTHRPPLEDSNFAATSLSIRGLQFYSPEPRSDETTLAVEDAATWLIQASTTSNEDRIFRLLGLLWSQADKTEIEGSVAEILEFQNEDGGWSQLSKMPSDAYATGQALVSLRQAAKLSATHDAYKRGIRFLLATQYDDGSWMVVTRSKPIQEYFESGFPHGKSQFISISGTCWASMGLILAMESDE